MCKKYYTSCELLPLWNFFKVNSGVQLELKYLIVAARLDYGTIVLGEKQKIELLELWDNIFEEYNSLEKNYGVVNFVNDRSRILYFYSLYLQEHALIKSLLYRTDANYISFLRDKGYTLRNTSNADYWEDLYSALKRVEHHITEIEIIKARMVDVEGESRHEGNPYDSVMAWIASNDIRVEEDITVSRYIKVKEIIRNRIKAKQKQSTLA